MRQDRVKNGEERPRRQREGGRERRNSYKVECKRGRERMWKRVRMKEKNRQTDTQSNRQADGECE